jgi:hypothetical protein
VSVLREVLLSRSVQTVQDVRRALRIRAWKTAVLLAAVLGTGCGHEPIPHDPAGLPSDTISAQLVAEIGAVRGAPEDLFGKVVSVAATPEGMIYVADADGAVVRAYDLEGEYVGTVGGRGEGPGEFGYLRHLFLGPGRDLYVLDAFRLTVFRPSSTAEFADSVVRTVPVRGVDVLPAPRPKTDGLRYFLPSYEWRDFLTRGYHYVVFDSTGPLGDTIRVPDFPHPEWTGRANYQVDNEGHGVGVVGINHAPFEAVPSWDITRGGRVFFSPGSRYEVRTVGPANDTTWVVRIAPDRRAVPAEEARDSLAAFGARLDSVPVPLGRVNGMSDLARSREAAEFLPEVLAVQIDGAGRTWIRRWPRPDVEETVFDVFDRDGRPRYTVRVPAELLSIPLPWVSRTLMVGVVRDSETGVDRVVAFRVPS